MTSYTHQGKPENHKKKKKMELIKTKTHKSMHADGVNVKPSDKFQMRAFYVINHKHQII